MSCPEELVSSLSNCWMSEGENDAHDDKQSDSCRSRERLKEPKRDVGLKIGCKVHFSRKTF
jgi:hypothetical protein